MVIPPFLVINTYHKKIFHNDVISLYIPKQQRFLSTGASFVYAINGVHDKVMSIPNGS